MAYAVARHPAEDPESKKSSSNVDERCLGKTQGYLLRIQWHMGSARKSMVLSTLVGLNYSAVLLNEGYNKTSYDN